MKMAPPSGPDGYLHCACTHLTDFGGISVRMVRVRVRETSRVRVRVRVRDKVSPNPHLSLNPNPSPNQVPTSPEELLAEFTSLEFNTFTLDDMAGSMSNFDIAGNPTICILTFSEPES